MEAPAAKPCAVYQLPLSADNGADSSESIDDESHALPEPVLIRNVFFFCRLRWLVAGLLAVFGIASFVPDLFPGLGLRSAAWWALGGAISVAAVNGLFLLHAQRLQNSPVRGAGLRSLWTQIVVDLAILTVVVHFVGRTTTYIMFTYLFHIGLACIFFSKRQSLMVVLLACLLFSACFAVEESDLLPPASVFLQEAPSSGQPWFAGIPIVGNAVSVMLIWLVMWFLTSRLSDTVRARDRVLARTNRQLLAAQEERAQHMLHTTHELKAPFAAIHSNAQLLTKGRCGELPEKAQAVVERIAARSRRLAREIQDMLQLANLSSPSGDPLPPEQVNLSDQLQWCIDQVCPLAEERGVEITAQLGADPVRVYGVEEHLRMMFLNLLSNAVTYSRKAGRVDVVCEQSLDGGAKIQIEDAGIGIPANKLPHIFDEYYRTQEAVGHWPESTGLGLAIVRNVAQTYGIRITVTSSEGHGTQFVLVLPVDFRLVGTIGKTPMARAFVPIGEQAL